ncbi:MAG: hypothetical protein E7493_13175 [Ruminococcus albus]|nr:hypothetical protein [Ruminococcus albus]
MNLNSWIAIAFSAKINIPIWLCIVPPLTHHKNSGYTELKVLGVWRSIILLFTAFLAYHCKIPLSMRKN